VGSTWDQSIFRSLLHHDESAGNLLESLSTEGYAQVFQGRLWHFANSVETYSKVYRRKDTLNFSKADFGILQTQKVMNLKQDSRNDYRLESQLLNITPTITSFR